MTPSNTSEIHPETGPVAAFGQVRFIMVSPSHPGNVGAAARAIKTMGFHDLCLVAPRFADVLDQPEAHALASGASDVLASVQIFPDLKQALGPVTQAYALTARARMIGPPACDIRVAAEQSCQHLDASPDNRVAIVLGTERSGLTNEDIALCQHICHIPANPEYSSLNVAQALQLAAWELRYALVSAAHLPLLPSTEGRQDAGQEPATSEKIQALMTHWEHALVEVGFLDPAHPKKLMPRMRHLFGRNALTQDEVDMMRGLCTAMIKSARQAER